MVDAAPERAIPAHYGSGNLRDRIAAALAQVDAPVTIELLAPVDEFHLGGRPATAHLIGQLGLVSTDLVLDIGSGIGGLARFIAATVGVRVVGVDLTEEYVDVANWLTSLVDLSDRVSFRCASAAALEFHDATFDAATMLHVGMNVDDKASLFRGIARVLRPGARFGVYDIMTTTGVTEAAPARLTYPLPWASGPATSCVEPLDVYLDALTSAGFEVLAAHDRTEVITAFLAQAAAAASTSGAAPSPLGIHLVMGREAPTKIANMASAVRAGSIAPIEIIARSGGH